LTRQQKKTLTILAIIGVIYFLIFIPPNAVGAEDRNMLTIFEIDEYAQYLPLIRMLSGGENFKESLKPFIFYNHYYYGAPFYYSSALLVLPLKLLELYTTSNIMLLLRQVMDIIPMILAVLILVYLHTRYKSLWKSVFLFIFLLSIPAVVKNNLWWHPDSLTFLFIAATLFFLDRDNLQFNRNFYFAAIACGLATGTKLLGLFFFLTIPTYIVWGYFSKKIDLKTSFVKGFQFVVIMVATFFLVNPMFFYAGPRNVALRIMQRQAEAMSFGWDVEYTKGAASWLASLPGFYGEGISLGFAFVVLIFGVIRGPRRLLNTLTLTWVVPFSLYLFFFIAIKPFHFYLPIALPLYASMTNLFPALNKESFTGPNKKNTRLFGGLSVLFLAVFGVQLYLNGQSDVEIYQEHLYREEIHPAISYFSTLEEEYLDQIPLDRQLRVSHDRFIYIPVSSRWKTRVTYSIIDYEYIQESNFDLLVFSRQRVIDYLQPDTLEKAVDKEKMMRTQELYNDVINGQVKGYELLFRDEFGIAFMEETLYQEYLKKNDE
jgi:hypothetical protein